MFVYMINSNTCKLQLQVFISSFLVTLTKNNRPSLSYQKNSLSEILLAISPDLALQENSTMEVNGGPTLMVLTCKKNDILLVI